MTSPTKIKKIDNSTKCTNTLSITRKPIPTVSQRAKCKRRYETKRTIRYFHEGCNHGQKYYQHTD